MRDDTTGVRLERDIAYDDMNHAVDQVLRATDRLVGTSKQGKGTVWNATCLEIGVGVFLLGLIWLTVIRLDPKLAIKARTQARTRATRFCLGMMAFGGVLVLWNLPGYRRYQRSVTNWKEDSARHCQALEEQMEAMNRQGEVRDVERDVDDQKLPLRKARMQWFGLFEQLKPLLKAQELVETK